MSTLRDNDGDATTAAAESVLHEGDANQSTVPAESVIELDALYHVLGNERRRRTLRYLLAVDTERVEMRTLADAVAAAEFDTTVDALSSEEHHRVYITLYQSHLPQMADAGIIEYDQDRGVITTTPHTYAVEPYLDRDGPVERDVPSWLWPGFAGTGLGIVFMLLVVEGFGPVATVVLTVLSALVALGIQTARSRFDVEHPLNPSARR